MRIMFTLYLGVTNNGNGGRVRRQFGEAVFALWLIKLLSAKRARARARAWNSVVFYVSFVKKHTEQHRREAARR